MRWRLLGGALVLTLLGGAAGFAVGAVDGDGTAPTPAVAVLEPVPADPSIPVPLIRPDPDDPTLGTGIRLRPEVLTVDDDSGPPRYEVRLPVPVGWSRAELGPGYWKYTVPGNSDNTYGLRVEVLADEGQSVPAAVDSRIAALRSTQTQGNMRDLEVEESDNGFLATFIDAGGYRRVNVERFFSGLDAGLAFVTVAVYGREQDRAGLSDLLDRISIDLRTSAA